MSNIRLIIFKRIQEIDKAIDKYNIKMYASNKESDKSFYKEKIDDLLKAKHLNESLYYGTTKTQ